MVHRVRSWARFGVAAFLVLLPLQPGFAGKCKGCSGKSGVVDSALAPPPCTQTPWGAWEISVSVDVYSGFCEKMTVNGSKTCVGEPCVSSVTYTWGAEVADAGLNIGYYEDNGLRKQPSGFLFPDGDPWKKGEFGTISFGPGNSPDIPCGTTLQYFIEGTACGSKFKAEVYGNCLACGQSSWAL